MRKLAVGMTLIFSSVLVAALGHGAASQSWNFDADRTGEIAHGFTAKEGAWKVIADPGAPSKPGVFAQVAKSSGKTFNLVLAGETDIEDLELSVRMKAFAGSGRMGLWTKSDAQTNFDDPSAMGN